MAFKIRNLQYRRWPVTIKLAECDAAGQVVETEQQFIGHFSAFTEADIVKARTEVFGEVSDEAMAKSAQERPLGEQGALDAEFYGRLMCGWEQLTDETGAELPFSRETLKTICTGPDGMAVRRGIGQAIVEIRFGVAPAKNAVTSPAPGPAAGPGEAEKTS
jgi:hypothetical protein